MRASRAATACPDGRMGARVVGSTAPEAATPGGNPASVRSQPADTSKYSR